MEQSLVEPELINLDHLGDWMQSQDLPTGPFENQRLLTGGTQNILLYFERGGRSFVLRRPPRYLRASSNRVMLREARVLQAWRGAVYLTRAISPIVKTNPCWVLSFS